jgi:hypothetical protein
MIATTRRHDGFGSHLYWTIAGINWSKNNNIDFKFTKLPTSYKNHQEGIVDTGTFHEWEYENVFGKEDMIKINNLFCKIMMSIEIENIERDFMCLNLGRKENIRKIVNSKKEEYFDKDINTRLSSSFKSLTKKPEIYLNNNLNIAIHIRRGKDLTGGTPRKKNHISSKRWVTGEYYDLLLDRLVELDNAKIHIFSQSDPLLNKKWKDNKQIIFHTTDFGSGEFYDHWEKMVYSDILILSPSVYSHSAAFFNTGKVVLLKNSYKMFPLSPEEWKLNNIDLLGGI